MVQKPVQITSSISLSVGYGSQNFFNFFQGSIFFRARKGGIQLTGYPLCVYLLTKIGFCVYLLKLTLFEGPRPRFLCISADKKNRHCRAESIENRLLLKKFSDIIKKNKTKFFVSVRRYSSNFCKILCYHAPKTDTILEHVFHEI